FQHSAPAGRPPSLTGQAGRSLDEPRLRARASICADPALVSDQCVRPFEERITMNPLFDAAGARRGLLSIVLAAVLWGTVGVATKALYGLTDTNPLSIGFFRLAIATPALLGACWLTLGRRMFQVTPRDLALMLFIGAATAFYQVCYFAAIARVGVAIAVLVTLCTAPVIVALISAGLLRERLSPTIILALICALAGTAMLVWI